MASVETVIDLSDVLDVEDIGYLIGKKGNNLKDIARRTKVILQVIKQNGRYTTKVRLTGVRSAVASARLELEELAVEILRRSFCHSVMIPRGLVAPVIGENGSKMHGICKTTGVKISLRGSGDGRFTYLCIRGTFRTIVYAVIMIKECVDNIGGYTSASKHPTWKFHE
uniref:KH domain-containing protein n=1 Tax=Angiostrongylus cantonensis TaxID=6313 RepID=A0A0K0D9Y1_ANGCA